MRALSVDEAMNWFLSNAIGELLCERADGDTATVDNFPAAKRFFTDAAPVNEEGTADGDTR